MIRLMFEQQLDEYKIDRWEVEGDDAAEAHKAMIDLLGSHLWVPRWSKKFLEASAAEHGGEHATEPTDAGLE